MDRASFKGLAVAALVALGIVVTAAQAHAQAQDALKFSWEFLVPGDYAVGGVDVTGQATNGFVSGTITIAGVPANADILAAYLYWETITTSADPTMANGPTFRGMPIDINNVIAVKRRSQDLTGQTASCWSSGSPLTMSMFRADVLRYLPLQRDKDGNYTGKRLVNTADLPAGDPGLVVSLPSRGSGNQVPESAGASLVVVYRNPDPNRTTNPLRKIVVYDGVHIQLPGEVTTQNLHGIFKSSTVKSARITHIASSGQKNPTEHIYFNGTKIAGEPNLPEPFPDASSSSERGWANPTFSVGNLLPGQNLNDGFGETETTAVDHKKTSPYECLAWGAIIFSAAIQDVDQDGLPDGIEDATPGSPLKGANGEYLPDLAAMGATSQHKDIFIEVNALKTSVPQTYGSTDYPYDSSASPPVTSVTLPPHTHMPTPEVLRLVAEAYDNAPVSNPDGTTGIHAHFDVGDPAVYHSLPPVQNSDWVDDWSSTEADQYIIGATTPLPGQVRGGEVIEEKACVPSTSPVMKCQFPAFPGTVGWKYRLEHFRDAPTDDNGLQISASDIDAWKAGAAAPFLTHRQRFDRMRKGLFHYVLYAHSRGKAKSPYPCLDSNGKPSPYDSTGSCTTFNPDFRVPSSSSGVADLAGYNVIVSLGLWPEFAKPFVRASTTLHELGHNGYLWHGGAPASWGNATKSTFIEPNCKPNYLSAMSYIYQVHGLFRDDNPDPQLDYSRGVFGAVSGSPLDETSLFDLPAGFTSATGNVPLYRPAWYAPSSDAGALATRFCSGARFPNPLPAGWVGMARFEALGATAPIAWGAGPMQDINFDGCTGTGCLNPFTYPLKTVLSGYDDWSNLRLDLLGSDRRLARFTSGSGDADFGGGDADFGGGDADFGGGDADFGGGDADFGGGDADFGGGDADFGGGDADFGGGDADFGGGDADFGGGGELDFQMAKSLGRTPPYHVTACVLGATCSGQQPQPFDPLYHKVQATWKSPLVGHVLIYRLYRMYGDVINAQTIAGAVQVGSDIPGTQLSSTDPTELPGGQKFTYFLKAIFDDDPNNLSSPSNFATITAVNDAPSAVNDSGYSVDQGSTLTVAAPGVLGNDTDDDTASKASLRTVLITSTANGTLTLGTDGSFTYVPNAAFAGIDSFTYAANDGTWSSPSVPMSANSAPATVTITVNDKTAPKLTLPGPITAYTTTNSVQVTYTATANDAVDGPITPVCSPASGSFFALGTTTVNCAATDKSGNTATGSFTVTVVFNTAPQAANDSYSTIIGTKLTVSAPGVLGNDTDAQGDGMTATLVTGPTHSASFAFNKDGSFTYTPAAGYVGFDTFTYTATDSKGATSTVATVTIAVRYKFINVQNLPPSNKTTFNSGSSIPLAWQWADGSGKSLNTSAVTPDIKAWVCSTSTGVPPPGLLGDFMPSNPGLGNSFQPPTASNNWTWQFNWKMQYTDATGTHNLPTGTYLVKVFVLSGGKALPGDPETSSCVINGVTITGAMIQVK